MRLHFNFRWKHRYLEARWKWNLRRWHPNSEGLEHQINWRYIPVNKRSDIGIRRYLTINRGQSHLKYYIVCLSKTYKCLFVLVVMWNFTFRGIQMRSGMVKWEGASAGYSPSGGAGFTNCELCTFNKAIPIINRKFVFRYVIYCPLHNNFALPKWNMISR